MKQSFRLVLSFCSSPEKKKRLRHSRFALERNLLSRPLSPAALSSPPPSPAEKNKWCARFASRRLLLPRYEEKMTSLLSLGARERLRPDGDASSSVAEVFYLLIFLANALCHGPPLARFLCFRALEWVSLIRVIPERIGRRPNSWNGTKRVTRSCLREKPTLTSYLSLLFCSSSCSLNQHK